MFVLLCMHDYEWYLLDLLSMFVHHPSHIQMLGLPLCTGFVQVSSTNVTPECLVRCDDISSFDLSLGHPCSASSVVYLTCTGTAKKETITIVNLCKYQGLNQDFTCVIVQ